MNALENKEPRTDSNNKVANNITDHAGIAKSFKIVSENKRRNQRYDQCGRCAEQDTTGKAKRDSLLVLKNQDYRGR